MAKNQISLYVKGEYIQLDSLLKATGIASTGGEAKLMIQDGLVKVDGEVELRRGRKLKGGETVLVQETVILLKGDTEK